MLTYNVNATQAYKRLLKGVVGCIEQRRVVTVGSTLDAFLTRTKKKKKEEEGKRERDDRGKKKKSQVAESERTEQDLLHQRKHQKTGNKRGIMAFIHYLK